MRYVKWTILTLLALFVIAFFHYTLPQHDVVRRQPRREVHPDHPRQQRSAHGLPQRGYGLGLAALFQSEQLRHPGDGDRPDLDRGGTEMGRRHALWLAEPVLHDLPERRRVAPGRKPRRDDHPVDQHHFTVLAAILFFFRRVWLQFRERTIDPALENMGERFDNLDARADTARANARTRWGRFRAWLRSGR
jgi:hypothetical protein